MKLKNRDKQLALVKGVLDMLPLSLAILPWGILVGSLAVQQGFSTWQAQLMSALVFAGAAQLVAIELISENASLLTLVATIFVISSRHFLYGLTLRDKLKALPVKSRLATGFVLTDELFALSGHARSYSTPLRIYYGLAAGFSMYLAWNCWTFIGIVAGSYLPDLTDIGLDFAIAVTFIALVMPSIKSWSILAAVVGAGASATLLNLASVELELIIAALVGMSLGYGLSFLDKAQDKCMEKEV